jgi:hypothetical protein
MYANHTLRRSIVSLVAVTSFAVGASACSDDDGEEDDIDNPLDGVDDQVDEELDTLDDEIDPEVQTPDE